MGMLKLFKIIVRFVGGDEGGLGVRDFKGWKLVSWRFIDVCSEDT